MTWGKRSALISLGAALWLSACSVSTRNADGGPDGGAQTPSPSPIESPNPTPTQAPSPTPSPTPSPSPTPTPTQPCTEGWQIIAAQEGGLEGLSLAKLDDRLALTWQSGAYAEEDTGTWLELLTPTGERVVDAIQVAEDSRVFAVENEFLRVGWDGIQSYSADGVAGELVALDEEFTPHAAFGPRLYGVVGDGPFMRFAAWLQRGADGDWALTRSELEVSYRPIIPGPEQFLVSTDQAALDMATLRRYRLENDTPILAEEYALSGEVIAAGAWDPAQSRFALLLGVRVPNTRNFLHQLLHLDEDAGLEIPEAYQTPDMTITTYEGLDGALAFGSGTTAVAWSSPFSAGQLHFERYRDGEILGGPLDDEFYARAYRTPPFLVSQGGHFSVMYARGAQSTAIWEDELLLRCDLAH